MEGEVGCSTHDIPPKYEEVITENGNNQLKKKPCALTSSNRPNSRLLNKMSVPVPHLTPDSDNVMANPLTKPKSGGDSLLNGIESSDIHTPRHHRRRSSQSLISVEDTPDVTDSVPTRIGKTKSLFDASIINPPDLVSVASASPSETGHEKNYPSVSFCTIFCALFKLKYIFSRYTILDLTLNLGSIGLYVFDFVTDWLNAFYYFFRNEGDDMFYFWLTVIFIAIPSLVMHAFSIWWEVEDNQHIRREKRKRNLKIKFDFCYYVFVTLFHLFQVAPIYRVTLETVVWFMTLFFDHRKNRRYCRTIYYGLKSRNKEVHGDKAKWKFYDKKYKGELSDVNFIRLMESFLESAPQLVLQIFIMVRTALVPTITVVSVCVSLFGMSISFVAYQRALRNTLDDKEQLSAAASVVLLLYRSFTNLSRVLALALLLNTNVWAWIGFFLVHWTVMTFAIAVQKTEFCPTRIKEYLYDIVIGFCYNFAYINVHFDSNNRYRMAFYYGLTFLTNTAIAICWFYLRRGGGSLIRALLGHQTHLSGLTQETVLPTEVALVLVLVVICCFVFGMFFFLIYYIALHPLSTGTICCPINNSDNTSRRNVVPLPEETSRPPTQVLHCGDNYRINRGAPQFRSWHSASLCYTPGDNDMNQKQKRPVSDVVKSSPSMLSEEHPQSHRDGSPLDSETKTRAKQNKITGYHSLASTSRGRASLAKEQHVVPKSSPSYTLANVPLRRESVDALKDAEKKRLQVTRLIEEKQRRKQHIEYQQALLRLDLEKKQKMVPSSNSKKSSQQNEDCLLGFEIHDFFDRKQRARHLYAKRRSYSAQAFPTPKPNNALTQDKSSMSSTPFLVPSLSVQKPTVAVEMLSPITLAPTAVSKQPCVKDHSMQRHLAGPRKRLYSAEEESPRPLAENRTPVVQNGTFPRCTRSGYRLTQQSASLRKAANLKPITENKLLSHVASTREHSTSLMDLALSQNRSSTSRTVPRAMSFTISKNEVVESMESSL